MIITYLSFCCYLFLSLGIIKNPLYKNKFSIFKYTLNVYNIKKQFPNHQVMKLHIRKPGKMQMTSIIHKEC